MSPPSSRPRVFLDADVIVAASASPSERGASMVILRLAEITLIEAITSEQVMLEVRRNLEAKLPQALPIFESIANRCFRVFPDPTSAELERHADRANEEDLPILVAASLAVCPWLVTFNVRHFQPGLPSVTVLRPGDYVRRARDMLSRLGQARGN